MPRWGHDAAVPRAMPERRGIVAGLGDILWRHKLAILGCIVIVLGLTAAYLSGRPPLYQATALVAIGEGSDRQSGQGAAVEDLEDQAAMIRSRAMAERLVERLKLQFVPEFQPDATSGSDRTERWLPAVIVDQLPKSWADTLAVGPGDVMTDEQRAAYLRNGVVEAVMSGTRAEVVRPMVLGLQFTSEDPQLAAAGANALAELYLEGRGAPRRDVSQGDRAARAQEIERLRASIRETEQAIAAARASADATTAPPGEQTRLDLTGELAFWRRERAEVEARLRRAEAALESGAALELSADVEAERLGALQAREAELEQALAELSQQSGEEDPQVVELRTELETLQTDKRGEIELIIARLRDEIAIIRSRETVLEAEIAKLEDQIPEGEAAGEANVLEQELEAERARLQSQLDQLEQLGPQGAQGPPGAQIITPAVAPDEPVHARAAMIYGVALAGALLLGILVAFGLEGVRRVRA